MNTCATCHFWHGPLRFAHAPGWGQCDRITWKATSDRAVVAREHEAGEDAWLETAPDFGCRDHQDKE